MITFVVGLIWMESTAGSFSGSTVDASPVENDPADFKQADEMSLAIPSYCPYFRKQHPPAQ